MDNYESGYIKLTQNSNIVEGVGTHFLNYINVGDILHKDTFSSVILSIESATTLTLTDVWVSNSTGRVEYFIERFPITARLNDYKEKTIEEINNLAGDKILSVVPAWKQRNYIARMVQLQSLNQVGSTEWNTIAAIWTWVETIRNHSNVAVDSVNLATTIAEIDLNKQNFIETIQPL